MLRALSRTQAIILAALLALACLWSATLSPPVSEAKPEADYSDIKLYHDIAERVAAGENYYVAATALQRAHHFPTTPFVTVREPTLITLAVAFGWQSLHAMLAVLLFGGALLWYRQLASKAAPAEAIGTVLAVLAGGAMVSQADLVAQYELWAGVLLTMALLLRGGKHWPWALAAAAAALAIRELALPFALLALVFALFERRQNEAIGWALLIALFALAMWFHASAVNAAVLPGDPPSQGWNAMRGAGAVLQDIVDTSLLNQLPRPFATPLALLALLGWAAVPLKQARFALLWFLGYGLMLALFARGQNFYWAIVLLPAWFIGFAFLPRALSDLSHAMLARRQAAL